MSEVGLVSMSQLGTLLEKYPEIKNGCLLDTNILISASLPIDPRNDAAEELIAELERLEIPVFSNVNIRSEFLEIQRRVLIPECLIEFYENDYDLDSFVDQKLKSVQTSYRKSLDNKKIYKFSDDRIKEFRELLSATTINGKNGWLYFCETYLAPQILAVWDEVVELCGLNFIKIRDGEDHPLLTSKVSWSGVNDLIGNYGIGSSDAMIVNLLLSSRLKIVATSDGDIQYLGKVLNKKYKLVLDL